MLQRPPAALLVSVPALVMILQVLVLGFALYVSCPLVGMRPLPVVVLVFVWLLECVCISTVLIAFWVYSAGMAGDFVAGKVFLW